MEFRTLDSSEQFDKIVQAKGSNIIYKHNTTCPISKSVKRKLEEEAEMLPKDTPVYILDLLSHRKYQIL